MNSGKKYKMFYVKLIFGRIVAHIDLWKINPDFGFLEDL